MISHIFGDVGIFQFWCMLTLIFGLSGWIAESESYGCHRAGVKVRGRSSQKRSHDAWKFTTMAACAPTVVWVAFLVVFKSFEAITQFLFSHV